LSYLCRPLWGQAQSNSKLVKIIDILGNLTCFFYPHITCIDLYLIKNRCTIQRKKRPLVETRGRIVKTNLCLLMRTLIYSFFSKSRISHVRRSNFALCLSYQLMYQAPRSWQNLPNFTTLLIFRYFLGRFVPGLKKTIAVFRSFAIFCYFRFEYR